MHDKRAVGTAPAIVCNSRKPCQAESPGASGRTQRLRSCCASEGLATVFRGALGGEAVFAGAVSQMLGRKQVVLHDFAQAMDEPRFFFDTDHSNRAGLTEFFHRHLKAILVSRD